MEKNNFKVLVVDDEPDWLVCNSATLRGEGYTVFTAGSGQEAIRTVTTEKPHLAFLDINMPEMDGLTLLKALKGIDPDIKVVMLTGYASIDRSGIAHSEGVVDFLEKIGDDPDDDSLGDEICDVAAMVFSETH